MSWRRRPAISSTGMNGSKVMVQPNSFDPEKPFYPLIMSSLVQVHGFDELFSRGIILLTQGKAFPPDQPVDLTFSGTVAELALSPFFSSGVTRLLTETALFGQEDKQIWELPSTKLSIELLTQGAQILPLLKRQAAGIMLLTAWEITEAYHVPTSPLWEFLRHCRNAAAHKGIFNFVGKEPLRDAEWRNRRIDSNLNGFYLIDIPEEQGFLTIQDALELLWDIEREYPEIRI